MLGFDEAIFTGKFESMVALRPMIEQLVDEQIDRGIDSVFLVGAGGTYAGTWAYEYWARQVSTLPVKSAISSELVLVGDAQLGPNSLVVFTSMSGTTEDVIESLEYVSALGAYTVAFTGRPGTPIAEKVDRVLYTADQAWPYDIELIYLFAYLFSRRGEFDGYELLAEQFQALPALLLDVVKQADAPAAAFAAAHRDTDYHFFIGSGNTWAITYEYSMCAIEEGQQIKTTRVNGAEFFHGSLELLEPDTSVVLFTGEDGTRPVMERVSRFVNRITSRVTEFDTADYQTPGIDDRFRGILSPVILAVVSTRISAHIAEARNHPMSTRRYYRVMDY